jgi:hypothetical protein
MRFGRTTKPPSQTDTADPAEVTRAVKAHTTAPAAALKATKARKEVAEDEAVSSSSEDEGAEGKKNSRHTFCPSIYREPILSMMEKHYCAHLLLPGYAHLSAEGIKRWAVSQMYKFCVEHGLREVWAYLWENQYRKSRWELWARSVHPENPNTQDDDDPGKPVSTRIWGKKPPFTHESQLAPYQTQLPSPLSYAPL